MSHFVVIGGGIAGLTAANALADTGAAVTLLEKSRTLGGRAKTTQVGGYFLNLGPHALVSGGIAARTFHQWNIPLSGGDPAERAPGRRAVIVRGTAHYSAVNDFASLVRSRMFSVREKLGLAQLLGFLKPEDAGQMESVNEWLHRRVDSERVRQYVQMAIRTATYSLDFDRLSARDALRQLVATTRSGVVYLDGGWQTLVNALVQRAVSLGVEIQTETSVASLSAVQADGIIVATDRQTAQQLVNVEFPASTPAYVACLDLCLKHLPDDAPTVAFAVDRPLYYSVHSAVAALAPPGATVVHVMKYLKDTTEEPQAIRRELEEYAVLVMPGWREVLVKDRFLPHLMVSAAIRTVYELSPANKLPTIEGVAFAGDWVGSEGMLTDAAVSSALNAPQSLLRACRT